jgi:hypothetical protein
VTSLKRSQKISSEAKAKAAADGRDFVDCRKYQRSGFHDWEECIDPKSGGFIRCRVCGYSIDCEDPDGDLG